jgi:hypothetical protein
MCGSIPDPPLYSPGGGCLVGYKVGVLVGVHTASPVGVQGNSSRSPSSTLFPSLHEYPGSMPDSTSALLCLSLARRS